MIRRPSPVVALWLICVTLAAIVVARARYITDLSAFLPAKPTAAQQLLIDQLREGPASRLILVAIEKGSGKIRTGLSVALAMRLRLDGKFVSVENGDPASSERDREFLFQHRYLLSESVTPERFSAAGLRAAIEETIDGLSSPAGLLLKDLVSHDPTGEMLQIIDRSAGTPGPQVRDGAWVSADGERSLLVVQTRAAGSDTDAQQRAIETLRRAFAAAVRDMPDATARQAQLRVSGAGVFAVAARAKIERAAVLLSMISSTLVIAVLLTVYRSVPALLLGLLPVATGALTGIAAVALAFGAVHGITLGFGITLIGESVDYSIYFFIQSRGPQQPGAESPEWRRLLWPTIRLGVLTSVCGFASLLPSGFPGLAQLGLYSISGLIAAALVTRYVLPELLPRGFTIRDLAPLGLSIEKRLQAVKSVNGLAVAALALATAALALAVLYLHVGSVWNRDLSALSPVPLADQNYDAKLRADLGSADVRDLVVVSGPDLESALRAAERAGSALEPLIDAQVIGGFDSPATFLPSMATQAARRASLPDVHRLRDNLEQATTGLAIRSDRLTPFLDDVEAARHAAPIRLQDLDGTSLAAGVAALLLHQQGRWNALLALHTVAGSATSGIDTARIAAALGAAHVEDAQVLDLKTQSDALYAAYLSEAIRLSLAGFFGLVLLLLIALRSPLRVARVLAPLALAVLIVAAGLTIGGRQLTILHLVGMLLIVAVGSNYALFFDRQGAADDAATVPLTLASLAIANVCTVIGFGLLSFSQVPVLEALGTTVAPGAFLALLIAALLAARRSHA
jgi:predicted exporter